MAHDIARILAHVVIFSLVGGLPILYVVFSDRFRQLPTPEEYASLFIIVGVAGVLLNLPALSILAATILLALGLAWISARYALQGIVYRRELSPARLFPGESADLTISLENRKVLPLAWLRIVDPIDFGMVRNDRRLEDVLAFSSGIERHDSHGRVLATSASLGSFQSLQRTYRVTGLKRGVYVFGPAEGESGDPFGIFPRTDSLAGRFEILVYPNVYPPDEIGLPLREMIGELVRHRALIEDPTFLAGSRQYRPGDPLRRVHWKATARTGELQVRVFEPSTTANLLIVVNLNTYQYLWQGTDLNRMEASIDAAASLAVDSLDRGYAVGMRANGSVNGSEWATRIPPSANARQSAVILEHLARLSFSSRFSAEHILLDETRRLEARTSILFVTPVLTANLVDILTSPRFAGRVAVAYCGRTAAPVVRGLPVHIVTPPRYTDRAAS